MMAVLETQAERAETLEQCRQRGLELAQQLATGNSTRKRGSEGRGSRVLGGSLRLVAVAQDAAVDRAHLQWPARRRAAQLDFTRPRWP
jgi:hypothetical protein